MKPNIPIKDKSQGNHLFSLSVFKTEVRQTQAHKHLHYLEIIFLDQGQGQHQIDQKTYNLHPPMLFVIRKEQVHHWHFSQAGQGYVLILNKNFLEKSPDNQLKNLLAQLSEHNCLKLEDKHQIQAYFRLMLGENNPIVSESLLKALVAKCLEASQNKDPKLKTDNLIQQFQNLLSQTKYLKNSVKYYSSIINTSPQNLNAICQKILGVSAKQVIAQYLISEARRQLDYTNKTITEIGFELGFSDASHFIKYFKRELGQTPKQYRKKS